MAPAFRRARPCCQPPHRCRRPPPPRRRPFLQVCPLLLRVFPRLGAHHQLEDFARRGDEPKDEVQIYTWMDATLRCAGPASWPLLGCFGRFSGGGLRLTLGAGACLGGTPPTNQPAVLGARCGLCQRCWVHRSPGPSSPLLLLPLRRRELSDLVKEVQPAARRPMARLSFAFVYPDRRGRNVMRQVGAASCQRTNPPPTALNTYLCARLLRLGSHGGLSG